MTDRFNNIPFFQGFSEELLAKMAANVIIENFNDGDTIFREGDDGNCMYIVENGEVEIRKKDKVLALIKVGETFGGMAIIEGEKRSADAISIGDTALQRIDDERFYEALNEFPKDAVGFLMAGLRDMSHRLRQTSEYLVTVFETGKIVGADYDISEMTGRILDMLLENIEDASSGIVILFNPYVEQFDEVARSNMEQAEVDKIIEAIGEASDRDISIPTANGVIFGVPLKNEDDVIGYICMGKRGAAGGFSSEQEIIISAVANQVGLGVLKAYNKKEEEDRQRLQQRNLRNRL